MIPRMKKFAMVLALALLFGSSASAQDENEKEPVRHVVAFKYRADASRDDIQRITDALRELRHSIPGIVSFEYGINSSPEGLNDGFTHLYLITFESAAARDEYLPHPEHEKFGELLSELGVLEEVFVIDYVPQD